MKNVTPQLHVKKFTYFILFGCLYPEYCGPKLEIKRNKNTTEWFSHAHNTAITFHTSNTTQSNYLLKPNTEKTFIKWDLYRRGHRSLCY